MVVGFFTWSKTRDCEQPPIRGLGPKLYCLRHANLCFQVAQRHSCVVSQIAVRFSCLRRRPRLESKVVQCSLFGHYRRTYKMSKSSEFLPNALELGH